MHFTNRAPESQHLLYNCNCWSKALFFTSVYSTKSIYFVLCIRVVEFHPVAISIKIWFDVILE